MGFARNRTGRSEGTGSPSFRLSTRSGGSPGQGCCRVSCVRRTTWRRKRSIGKLCEFAVDQGARYVLMNPLGSMGRGVKSQSRLAQSEEHMQRIYELTAPFEALGLEVVHIRFPNAEGTALAGCEAGTIIYVFTPGEVTVCPYLVFAARTPQSKHDPEEFIVGNIFTHRD